jgi:DNA-binding transcriptional LysR family regulator
MPLTRFTLRQLEAFAAVAELRNFTAAAERLGLTAQAVSQLVAELEATIGFRVFDRTTRRVALSSAGRDFLPSALSVLRHLQAADSAADDLRRRAAGLVRVGAPLVLAGAALPAAIRAHGTAQPRVVVRIRDLAVDKLADAVAEGDVDLAVGPDRPTGTDVAAQPLFDSPWVLWCAPTHPLAKARRLRWADLREQPLVAAGRDHERSVAQMRLSAPADARVTPVDVVDNISTALGLAAEGLAATLAPAYVGVLAQNFGLVMRRVVEPETVRQVCLYRPLVRAMSPAAQSFAEHLAQWLPRWAAAAAAAGAPARKAARAGGALRR